MAFAIDNLQQQLMQPKGFGQPFGGSNFGANDFGDDGDIIGRMMQQRMGGGPMGMMGRNRQGPPQGPPQLPAMPGKGMGQPKPMGGWQPRPGAIPAQYTPGGGLAL